MEKICLRGGNRGLSLERDPLVGFCGDMMIGAKLFCKFFLTNKNKTKNLLY
jgi:hypothetical protein